MAELRQAVALAPDMADARNSLGLALMKKGEGDEAASTFEALVKSQPGNLVARHNLGSALLQKGDLDGAAAVYRELTGLDPKGAEAFYNLGMALKQKDNFAGAEEALRQAIARAAWPPRDAWRRLRRMTHTRGAWNPPLEARCASPGLIR